jgi:hypothetical protein
MVTAGSLPRIDEHATTVSAPAPVVWDALLHIAEHSFGSPRSTAVARALGCRDDALAGPRPLAAGSAFPGFHVVAADAPRQLELAGSHRFSRYALIFRLDELAAGRAQLRAESRAEFPGLHGAVYRALVIGTRGHVLAVGRLLTAVKRRAEQNGSAPDPGAR